MQIEERIMDVPANGIQGIEAVGGRQINAHILICTTLFSQHAA